MNERKPTLENNEMKQLQIRQGDVLLVPVKEIPSNATKDVREDGRFVLAHGEVTGHAHVIDRPAARSKYVMTPEGARFVKLVKETALRHEEHSAIQLVQGVMQQGFQCEDFGEEIRRVAD